MDKKFLIVLFVTVFYNGVTYSSPVKEITSDLISKEKQVNATAVTDHVAQKVESSSLAPQNVSHIESPTSTNSSSVHVDGNGKTVPENATAAAVDKKSEGTPSVKNETLSAGTNGTIQTKNSTVAPLNATTSATISNATSSSNTSSPAPVPKSTSDVAPEKVTEMPRPLPAGQSTTGPTTAGTVKTTEAPPATKPTVKTTTTAAPTTTETPLKDQHDSSSKAEQKGGGFDGASFVGGIVLTIGLTAIGFIAFKFYKSGKIDGNYGRL